MLYRWDPVHWIACFWRIRTARAAANLALFLPDNGRVSSTLQFKGEGEHLGMQFLFHLIVSCIVLYHFLKLFLIVFLFSSEVGSGSQSTAQRNRRSNDYEVEIAASFPGL
jgi:hypothetical protein